MMTREIIEINIDAKRAQSQISLKQARRADTRVTNWTNRLKKFSLLTRAFDPRCRSIKRKIENQKNVRFVFMTTAMSLARSIKFLERRLKMLEFSDR